MDHMHYENQVIIVTGAGSALGKQYAKLFAARGAKLVVNDIGVRLDGTKLADIVVDEIRKDGGVAVANYDAVQNGDKILSTAIGARTD